MLGTSKGIFDFDPRSIGGCQLWLDAADAATVTGNATVTSWKDKSSRKYNLIPGTGTTSYSNNAITITASYMYATADVDLTRFTFFIVAKNNNTTSNQPIFAARPNTSGSYNSTDGFSFYMDLGTQTRFYGGYPTTGQQITTAVTTSVVNLYSFTGTNTGFFNQWTNGRQVGAATYTTRTSTAKGFAIGGEWSGSAYSAYASTANSIYEVLVYDSVLTVGQRQSIENYLAKKWSLTLSPLLITSPLDIPGCAMWFDAADPSTFTPANPTTGTTITQWNDKSSNANHLVKGSTGAPTYQVAGYNSRPAVYFNATTSQWMQAATAVNFQTVFSPSNGRTTRFMVFSQTGGVVGGMRFQWTGNGSGNSDGVEASGVNGMVMSIYGTNVTLANALNQPLIISFVVRVGNTTTKDSTDMYCYGSNVTGNPVISLSTVPSAIATWNYSEKFVIGAKDQLGNYGATGYHCEYIVYNQALSTAQSNAVLYYLAAKWGMNTSVASRTAGTVVPFIYRPLSRAFSPLDIPGCAGWWDASDLTTISGTSTVTFWGDKSTSFNYFYPSTGTVSTGTYNGYPVLSFPSGAIMTTSSQITFTTSSAFFIVFRLTTMNGQGLAMVLAFTNIATGSTGDYSIRVSTTGLSGTPASVGNSQDLGNANYYVNGSFNPSFPLSTYSNSFVLVGTTVPTTSGTSYLQISSSFSSRYFIGNVCEVLYYPAGVTAPQRQQIEGYLADKWGISTSLPGGLLTPMSVSGCQLWLDAADYKTMAIGTAPYAYFPFDGSILDQSNAVTFTRTGSVPFVNGRIGNAVYFSNTAGVLSSNFLSTSYNLPSTFTAAFWFQTPNATPNAQIFCTAPNSGYSYGGICAYLAGGNLYHAYSHIQNGGIVGAISANTWYHVALTYNNGTCLAYLNGALGGSPVTAAGSSINGFTVGGGADIGPDPYPFTGLVDDLRIFTSVLTAAQISNIYVGNVTAWTDKAQSITMTPQGTTTFLKLPVTSIGSLQSVLFDNPTNANVYLSGAFQSITTGCVFIVWKSLTQSAANYYPIFTWNSGSTYPAYGQIGGAALGTYGPYTAYGGAGTPTFVATANTNYLTFYSWSGTTPTVGINGATPTSGTQPAFSGSTTTFWIGADSTGGAQRTNMNLGELIIFNSVLGSSQRQSIENYLLSKWGFSNVVQHPFRSIPPSTVAQFSPLAIPGTALWIDPTQDTNLDGATITTIPDRSGNGITLSYLAPGTITLVHKYRNNNAVYNFGSARASNASFSWGTSFTHFVVASSTSGGWLNSAGSGTTTTFNLQTYVNAANWDFVVVNNSAAFEDRGAITSWTVSGTATTGLSPDGRQSVTLPVSTTSSTVTSTYTVPISATRETSFTVFLPATAGLYSYFGLRCASPANEIKFLLNTTSGAPASAYFFNSPNPSVLVSAGQALTCRVTNTTISLTNQTSGSNQTVSWTNTGGNWALFFEVIGNGGNTNTTNYSYINFDPGRGQSIFSRDSSGLRDSWNMLSVGYTSGSTTLTNYTVNGYVRASTNTTATTSITPPLPLYINGSSTGQYDSTYFAEIIHYNRALTTQQRQAVEGYLAWKWGLQNNLPTSHPYYKFPPGYINY